MQKQILLFSQHDKRTFLKTFHCVLGGGGGAGGDGGAGGGGSAGAELPYKIDL